MSINLMAMALTDGARSGLLLAHEQNALSLGFHITLACIGVFVQWGPRICALLGRRRSRMRQGGAMRVNLSCRLAFASGWTKKDSGRVRSRLT